VEVRSVAHACNPSYSGDRDQEDRWFKASLRQVFMGPYLKKNLSQNRLVEWPRW
jgi:hypothetical protein